MPAIAMGSVPFCTLPEAFAFVAERAAVEALDLDVTFRLFFDVFLKGIADHAHFGIFRITSGDFQCLARGSGGIAGRQEQDHKQQGQDLWAFHRVSLP